jgi:hypothetical protein
VAIPYGLPSHSPLRPATYFAKLTKAQQQEERERHAGYDEQLERHRVLHEAKLFRREGNRKDRALRKVIKAAGFTRKGVETMGLDALRRVLLEERMEKQAESLRRLKHDPKTAKPVNG